MIQMHFFFLLVNPSIKPEKGKVIEPQHAIYCFYALGPSFGLGDDLRISSDSNINQKSYSNKRSY